MKFGLKTSLVLWCLLGDVICIFTPIVEVEQGKLRGLRSILGQNRYYGIPYATSKRFKVSTYLPLYLGINQMFYYNELIIYAYITNIWVLAKSGYFHFQLIHRTRILIFISLHYISATRITVQMGWNLQCSIPLRCLRPDSFIRHGRPGRLPPPRRLCSRRRQTWRQITSPGLHPRRSLLLRQQMELRPWISSHKKCRSCHRQL